MMQAHPQIKLRGIQYDEARLTVDLSLPDFQAMETLKNALIARGMQVETVGANSTDLWTVFGPYNDEEIPLGFSSKGPATFGAEKPILDREGKPLRFHNW